MLILSWLRISVWWRLMRGAASIWGIWVRGHWGERRILSWIYQLRIELESAWKECKIMFHLSQAYKVLSQNCWLKRASSSSESFSLLNIISILRHYCFIMIVFIVILLTISIASGYAFENGPHSVNCGGDIVRPDWITYFEGMTFDSESLWSEHFDKIVTMHACIFWSVTSLMSSAWIFKLQWCSCKWIQWWECWQFLPSFSFCSNQCDVITKVKF